MKLQFHTFLIKFAQCCYCSSLTHMDVLMFFCYSHTTETTHWDHPKMSELLQQLGEYRGFTAKDKNEEEGVKNQKSGGEEDRQIYKAEREGVAVWEQTVRERGGCNV